jgi:hypothetical protein
MLTGVVGLWGAGIWILATVLAWLMRIVAADVREEIG